MCQASILGIIFLFVTIFVLAGALNFLIDGYNRDYGWFMLVISILTGIISALGFIYKI